VRAVIASFLSAIVSDSRAALATPLETILKASREAWSATLV